MRGSKIIVLVLALLLVSAIAQAKSLRFGVPPWPGVTVKTEVAMQILDALGYPSQDLSIGPPIIYNGFKSGEVDIFLGAWIPQQNDMLNPMLKKGIVKIAQTNLDTAVISLCVPRYVADAGVKSFGDLAPHAKKFHRTIYDIEEGSGMHTAMDTIIKNNVAGLRGWRHMGATTSMMLKEVESKIKEKKWVVFGCWKPHWMNLSLEMTYLKGVKGTESYSSKSVVYTVVRSNLNKTDPQVYRFLKQLRVRSQTQSAWIRDYGKEHIPASKVAKTWISAHKDIVAQWLDGVKAADGAPAMTKINKVF